MERVINLHIEKLPEGVYLATSDDFQNKWNCIFRLN